MSGAAVIILSRKSVLHELVVLSVWVLISLLKAQANFYTFIKNLVLRVKMKVKR
jgi:hypothetical protein